MANAMTALANIGVPNLGGVLMVPMKDVGKDFSQLAAGDMADSTTGVMQGTSAGQVDQSMTEQITGLLSRGLKSRLTETLVPPLKQTVVSETLASGLLLGFLFWLEAYFKSGKKLFLIDTATNLVPFGPSTRNKTAFLFCSIILLILILSLPRN